MLPEEIAAARQRRYNGTIVWLTKPNPDLMIMRVKPDFPIPRHRAGQYCSLGLGNWEPRTPGCQPEELKPGDESRLVRRAYSLSHPILNQSGDLIDPSQADYVEFYITLVREGSDPAKPPALTPRLFLLKEGDRLNIGDKITGHYTLEQVKPTDTVVLLGTGTGEAPHNYMTWELLRDGHAGKVLNACCVRYKRDLGYIETHRRLVQRFGNYQYLPLTTREPDTIDQKVYIQDLITSGQLETLLSERLDPTKTHVFLCGNPKMIGVPGKDPATGARVYPQPTGVIEVLEQRGFQADIAAAKFRGNVHFEEYW
jgi:ferredoxin/flavodoxin---NADP+ reductase